MTHDTQDVPPPAAADSDTARRLGSLQTLCQGTIVGLVGVTVGFWLVVQYALDGIPLAGNGWQVGGVSILVWAAALAAVVAPVVAVAAGRARGRAGVTRVAAAHPELAGSADEADRLFDVFAAVVFTEYAVTLGTGFALAVLFHVTSLAPVVAAVAALVLFAAARYPTGNRSRAWLAAAHADLTARRPRKA